MKKIIYLAVDLDKELFFDDNGASYSLSEVKDLLNKQGNRIDMTLKTQRLLQQFNGDFNQAKEFYKVN